MFQRIVVALDGSELAARALPYAARLAGAALSGRLVLVRAVPGGAAALDHQAWLASRQEAETALTAEAERLQADGHQVDALLSEKNPVTAILGASRGSHADLIVMSSRGQGGVGQLTYGSVVGEVLRRTALPVLLISPVCDRSWDANGDTHVAVALDGSTLAEAALAPAGELAAALGSGLLLVRVVERPGAAYGVYVDPERVDPVDKAAAEAYLAGLLIEPRGRGQSAEARALTGAPVPALTEVADAGEVLALAMATHGRSGLARLLAGGTALEELGSVPRELLRHARAPILIVRPEMLRPA